MLVTVGLWVGEGASVDVKVAKGVRGGVWVAVAAGVTVKEGAIVSSSSVVDGTTVVLAWQAARKKARSNNGIYFWVYEEFLTCIVASEDWEMVMEEMA